MCLDYVCFKSHLSSVLYSSLSYDLDLCTITPTTKFDMAEVLFQAYTGVWYHIYKIM